MYWINIEKIGYISKISDIFDFFDIFDFLEKIINHDFFQKMVLSIVSYLVYSSKEVL